MPNTRGLEPFWSSRKTRGMRLKTPGSPSEGVAAHLLQIWLIGAHKAVLCDFLDALGIGHDDNGTIDNLPEAPPKEKLQPAVETLLAKHDRHVVAVYLHAFQALDENGWPTLEELLAQDERLRLEPATPVSV